jgi:hypothetical protein
MNSQRNKWYRDKRFLVGSIVVPVVLALIGLIYAKSSNQNSLTNVSNTGIITQGIGSTNIINIPQHRSFSSTQRIIVAPRFLGGNDVLDLDNVATLTLFPLVTRDRVILSLDELRIPVIPGSDIFKISGSIEFGVGQAA